MNEPDSPSTGSSSSGDTIMLILAYFGPLALIPYLTDQNDYVKWHAKQGLTLTGAWIVFSICWSFLVAIPLVGWLLLLLMPFLSLAVLALVIVAIVKAINGERWRMPLIADLAEKW